MVAVVLRSNPQIQMAETRWIHSDSPAKAGPADKDWALVWTSVPWISVDAVISPYHRCTPFTLPPLPSPAQFLPCNYKIGAGSRIFLRPIARTVDIRIDRSFLSNNMVAMFAARTTVLNLSNSLSSNYPSYLCSSQSIHSCLYHV